ncbi:hypothetical protein BE15_16725 [Sorangium cellulosum]|uniref:Uncharacterized protein n=1 Tax=Sorangium cellulosum TaxID=56 RepID=A0A150QQS3_SORCE|nr:hypothetical protein BE15_16725 [Sorangium cellulosum]
MLQTSTQSAAGERRPREGRAAVPRMRGLTPGGPSTISRRAASVAVGNSAAVAAGASTGARLVALIGIEDPLAPPSGVETARSCAGLLDKVGQPSATLPFHDAWGRHVGVGSEFKTLHAEATISEDMARSTAD